MFYYFYWLPLSLTMGFTISNVKKDIFKISQNLLYAFDLQFVSTTFCIHLSLMCYPAARVADRNEGTLPQDGY